MQDHLSLDYGQDDRGSSLWICVDPVCAQAEGGFITPFLKEHISNIGFLDTWEYKIYSETYADGITLSRYIKNNLPEVYYKVALLPDIDPETICYEVTELLLLIPVSGSVFGSIRHAGYFSSWKEISEANDGT